MVIRDWFDNVGDDDGDDDDDNDNDDGDDDDDVDDDNDDDGDDDDDDDDDDVNGWWVTIQIRILHPSSPISNTTSRLCSCFLV